MLHRLSHKTKGQTGIELMILGIMAVVGVLAIYLPPVLFKSTSEINIQYEYHYDNAQSLLLSTLSTTVTDTLTNTPKTSLELLGEYIQLQNKPDNSKIQKELSNLANGINVDCYKLSADTDIAKSSCEPSQYQAATQIPLPYNPSNLVKTIKLVIVK